MSRRPSNGRPAPRVRHGDGSRQCAPNWPCRRAASRATMGGGMGARMGEYPNIADHGLIGDLQTAALVDTDGTIDWFCAPRFDSPSIFGSLLDAERGGFCRVRPDDRRLRVAAAVPAEHRHPHHALHDRGGRRRGGRLHARRRGRGDRPPPPRAHAARGARHDVVRGGGPAEVRLRAGAAHDRARRQGDGAKFVADDLSLTLHRVGDPVLHGTERAGHIELLRRRHPRHRQPQRRGDGGRHARDGRRRAEAHPAGRDGRDAARRPRASGGTGTTAPPTAGGGARWSPARR